MQRKLLIGLFLAPTVIGLGLFTFLPILASVVLAFFSWDIITPPRFVGLENFADIAADPTIRVSFLNTIGFVVVAVTLQLAVALVLAVLVNTKMPGLLKSFFRSVLFFPLVLSAASVSIIMGYLFNENFGLVNHILNLLGMADVPWLTSTHGAMIVVILVYVCRTSASPSCCSWAACPRSPRRSTRPRRSTAPRAGSSSGGSHSRW